MSRYRLRCSYATDSLSGYPRAWTELLSTGIENGEDEGSLVCTIVKSSDREHVVTLTMMVSGKEHSICAGILRAYRMIDTSEYPTTHSFICFAQDEDVPPYILQVVQDASDAGSRPIVEMIKRLLTSISKKTDSSPQQKLSEDESENGSVDEDDSESMYDGHYDDDDFDHFGLLPAHDARDVDMSTLQRSVDLHCNAT